MFFDGCNSQPLQHGVVLGEMEEWGNQMRLSGDFYQEPDTVTRGVSMASAPLPLGFNGIDPCTGTGDYAKGLQSSYSFETCPWEHDSFSAFDHGLTFNGDGMLGVTSSVAKFTEVDFPPSLPVDDFFELEVTALRIEQTAAFKLMNLLLDFFATQVTSSVSKINTTKFTIKADVFMEGLSCALKMRCYGPPQGSSSLQCFLEFQRRKGDSVVFNKVFALAEQYLQPSAAGLKGVVDPGIFPVADEKLCLEEDQHAQLAPLWDMASASTSPELQAEAVNILADKAQNASQVASCIPGADTFQCFKELLQHDRVDIAYPTAVLLKVLSTQEQIVTYFADYDLLKMIADRAISDNTALAVKKELAHALQSAAERSAQLLRKEDAQLLGFALEEAILNGVPMDRSVEVRIQQALVTFKKCAFAFEEAFQLAPAKTVVQCNHAGVALVDPQPISQASHFIS